MCFSGWAQGTRALITGIVHDPSGAAVPAADMSLRALATSAVSKASTGADGYYTFPNLVAGVYELSISAKGFRDYVQRGITVNLDQQVRIDVALEIGATTDTVQVVADASP
ncbi:MAG TPA: carboxypeptidase-like regulatory domain-containing protein, partial [Verrucomicrobiae bacterium]|nr:carboxypeptidase-like regulatory domain-containing protein [Verrucomicrobiae bacterium]